MNPYAIPPLVVSVLLFALAWFILIKNKGTKSSNFLFILLTAVSLWLFADSMLYGSRTAESAYVWAKISYLGVIFIPVFFFHFSLSFLRITKFKLILVIGYLLGCLFQLSLLSPYLVSGVSQHYWGYYHKVNFLHYFFLLYFAFILSSTFWILYSHSKDKGRPQQERNKIKLVLFAFIVSFQALWTDLLPKYGVEIYPVGFAPVSVWLLLVIYAIAKHRLFDIKIVINRGAVFALTFFLGVLPAALIIFFLQKVFPLTTHIAIILILAASLAFLFGKIHPYSERFVQKRLLKNELSYYQILRKFSKDMVGALDLQNLLERFDHTLRETMQVNSIAIYLTGPLNGTYPLMHATAITDPADVINRRRKFEAGEAAGKSGVREIGMVAPHHSGLIPFWSSGDALVTAAYQAKDVLVLGEMEMMARERKNKQLEEAIVQMREAKAEVCMPLKRDGKMIGIALLGPREGDRYYSPQDLDLLHVLGRNACVAVQNAILVEEIKKSHQILHRTQRFAAIGDLIAGLSHEIRNPLMPISYLLEYLDDPSVEQERIQRQSENSRKALHRITSVLREMEDLARPYRSEFKQGHINRIADDAIDALAIHISLRKQTVLREYALLPPATVDAERLKQALKDILLNAVEASEEGATIYIHTRELHLRGSGAQSTRPGIQVEVTDFGSGIPPEYLERVFDPFFTTKHKSVIREGTGLGLSISHRIVEEHGGSIEIRSEPGKGTSVFINLPVEQINCSSAGVGAGAVRSK